MRQDILEKLYKNEEYLDYLRRHPKWYFYLDQDPNTYSQFEKVVKKELKITTVDKLDKVQKQINFANALLQYIRK